MVLLTTPLDNFGKAPCGFKALVAAAAALALGTLSTGCVALAIGAAGAGAAGVAYVRGDLEGSVNADPRDVEHAAKEAFEALEIRLVSSASSALDAEVIGRTARDKRVRVKAASKGERVTSISIRIGNFGDESMSRRVFDELKDRLQVPQRDSGQ